ncbi:uncharacterized protein LOC110773259 [Prunus avium]|uniref:Uncharacterized protein LOC110773259 n=1 Tax=Prunus avium TaxID=42229 RepID=A0A6P5U2X0_PRUAV|nr:uncharacterized protein LOC110773259 [Prunus avium]
MTPKDFSAITGLPVCGKPLKYDMEAHKKPKEVVRLFGTPIASLINTKIKYRDIVEKYKGWKPQTAVQEHHLAKVDEIKDYNWGGAGLSCLYLSMDAISRRIVSSSGGYWRAWEVWACEYLKPLALSRPCTDEDSQWPRALRWLSAPDVRETSHNLEQFRITLRYITTDQVNWYPWGTDDTTLPHYVQSSIPATKQRILLQGPAGYAWYLGERVAVQSLGAPDQRIPKRPPPTMLKDMKVYAVDNKTKASLKGFKADDWFAEKADYGVFRNEYVRYKHYPSVTDNVSFSFPNGPS